MKNKDNKREYEYQIDFLKNKMQAQIAQLNIYISRQNNQNSVLIALLVGVSFPIYLAFGLLHFFLSFFLFGFIWLYFAKERKKRIDKVIQRIFAIGHYIKGIYGLDLGVNVDYVERTLDGLNKLAPEKIKEHLKKKKK